VPDLTIAVIHHRLRGYPEDCLESLMTEEPCERERSSAPLGLHEPSQGLAVASQKAAGTRRPVTEVLLVQTDSVKPPRARAAARVIPVPESLSRAAAKNLAVAEARGEFLLLVTADTVARPGAVGLLRNFLVERRVPAVASAQLLCENGTRRRTSFPTPSIAREVNPLGWLCRSRRWSRRSSGPPAGGPAVRAQALHSTFLMARRETFRAVGEFAEGYRFAFEDVEWCGRARKKGIELCVCPDSQVFQLPPQLRGELPPAIRADLESSRLRCVRALRGAAYGRAFRAVRRSKSLAAWFAAASLNRLLGCNSDLLASRAAVHRAIWRLPADAAPSPTLAPDLESHVAWEMTV